LQRGGRTLTVGQARLTERDSVSELDSTVADPMGDFLLCAWRDPAAVPGDLPRRLNGVAAFAARGQFATPSAGVAVWWTGNCRCRFDSSGGGVGLAHEPDAGRVGRSADQVAEQALLGWLRTRTWSLGSVRGRFGYAFWDAASRPARLTAVTDCFRTVPLVYAVTPEVMLCATDLRLILATGCVKARARPDAIYHYLNFSYVPAPVTAIEGIVKLPAAHRVDGGPSQANHCRYWDPTYAEDLDGDDDARAAELRDVIVSTVQLYRPSTTSRWGTFLSGGTDSSSISGIMARMNLSDPVASFSIGFSEAGYDELGYARIASRAFNLDAHERRVGEVDAVAVIPQLSRMFDEPYGNSSAIPTYYCARLAVDAGKDILVAGDGGDEIFGGNERYRKDRLLEAYFRAPAAIHSLGSLAARALNGVDRRFANRIKNFIRRASVPNPERFYSDDAFASAHFNELLTPEFRVGLNIRDSLDLQRCVYDQVRAQASIHRLMYLDLKMTIADNDVQKVVRASRMAGLSVVFPYLDRELVDYCGRLPGSFKLRRLQKRYLFKQAMGDILPVEIRRKKKAGFGLPVSVWLRQAGSLRDLLHDVVLSPRALERGYFQSRFVRHLIERHERGVWDHGSELYLLLMLELWHREVIERHG
jgi:asparagine synthase (glutamine-hydrolysing)